jgi:hypothetical protein
MHDGRQCQRCVYSYFIAVAAYTCVQGTQTFIRVQGTRDALDASENEILFLAPDKRSADVVEEIPDTKQPVGEAGVLLSHNVTAYADDLSEYRRKASATCALHRADM